MSDKKTILIVEDEGPAALALSDVLKSEGFEVLVATNGKEGLATAIAKRPDMILADLKMPEMGGLEMIREIRKEAPWGTSVPVVILSNVADGATVADTQDAGAADYFIKGDIQMSEIISRIRSRLAETR